MTLDPSLERQQENMPRERNQGKNCLTPGVINTRKAQTTVWPLSLRQCSAKTLLYQLPALTRPWGRKRLKSVRCSRHSHGEFHSFTCSCLLLNQNCCCCTESTGWETGMHFLLSAQGNDLLFKTNKQMITLSAGNTVYLDRTHIKAWMQKRASLEQNNNKDPTSISRHGPLYLIKVCRPQIKSPSSHARASYNRQGLKIKGLK